MSREHDKEMAKWLVKNSFLDRTQAQDLFKKQSLLIKQGRNIQLLELAVEEKLLDKQIVSDIEKQLPDSLKEVELKIHFVTAKAKKSMAHDEAHESTPPTIVDNLSEPDSVSKIVTRKDALTIKYCIECQAQIPSSAKQCPICAAALPKTYVVHCVICYRLNDSKHKHCGYCGCNIHTGVPGTKTIKCGSCKNTMLPDQAFCMKCGTLGINSLDHAVTTTGKVFMVLLFVLGYTAFMFSLNFLQVQLKYSGESAQAQASDYALVPVSGLQQKSLLAKGLKLAAADKWSEVSELLENEKKWLDSDLLHLLAFAWARLGRVEDLQSVQTIHQTDPYINQLLAESLYQFARAQAGTGELAVANNSIRKCLTLVDDNPAYFFWAGIINYGLKDYPSSQKFFHKALELQAAWPECHLFLYLLKQYDGDTEAAGQHLKLFKSKSTVLDIYNELLGKISP